MKILCLVSRCLPPVVMPTTNQEIAVPTITNPFNRFFVFQQIIIFCAFVCSVTLQWRSCSHITHPEWPDGLNDKVGSSSVSYLGYRVQTLVWKPAEVMENLLVRFSTNNVPSSAF